MATEKRLIDANALKAVIKKEECNCEVFPWVVDNAPTVDAVEVVHGRWEFVEQRFYHGGFVNLFRCSECKVATDKASNYCPNCGAKMDGVGNE